MTDREPDRFPPGGPTDLTDDAEYEGLVRPEDLTSASRSCSAILVVFVVIALLLCVFLVGTIFYR